ncbi:MAG: pyridoxal phosphate-dependent aminotransferase [Clostridia bacterium]|nr:pyridoxal phosphate-dependent aminotransferase [Clostridia bacterium]
MRLSDRAKAIKPSPTFAVEAKAAEMRKRGIEIVGFGAGEPDFDTPEHIRAAGIEAINQGFTRYTPTAGIPELKRAIVAKFERDNGLHYEPSQIIVSCGAKHSLYNAFQALVGPGDEVIVPAPYWVSYPDQVRMAGAVPVIIDTAATAFRLTPEALEGAITPNTRAMVINSPSNPTGVIYSREDLAKIADIAIAHDLAVISDDIYESLLAEGMEFVSIASLSDEIKTRTVVVNGVSKTYAMTGWRIGYAAAEREVIAAMSNIQAHSTSNPCSISQKAALAALAGSDEPCCRMVREFRARGVYMHKRLAAMPGIECVKPAGAFYCFPKVSSCFGKSLGGVKVTGSVSFADALLEQAHVAVVAGAGFGSDDYVRLSYATSMEKIEEGLGRIERALADMK